MKLEMFGLIVWIAGEQVNVQPVMETGGAYQLGLMEIIMKLINVLCVMVVEDVRCAMAIEDVMSDKFSESDNY